MSELRAVFFDLYGTLTIPHADRDFGPSWSATATRCFAELGVDTSGVDPVTLREEIWDDGVYSAEADGTPFEHRLASYLNRAFGASFTRRDLTTAADTICRDWQRYSTVDPSAAAVISQIKQRRAVGLVSNFDHPPHVRRLLSEAGLDELFGVIVISGEEGREKPDPEIMLVACDRLGAAPAQSAYVGDSYGDYQAATEAGMRFFWLRRPEVDALLAGTQTDRFAQTDAELHRRAEAGEFTLVRSLDELAAMV